MQRKGSGPIHFDFRLEMAKELRLRQARNPQYSLRSFARDLGVSVTALSDVLGAKRNFSKKNAFKIIEKLGWSPLQAQTFLEHKKSTLRSKKKSQNEIQLQDDRFRMISDWYYLVILNMAKIKGQSSNPEFISKKLGISAEDCREALQRLTRLGFIQVEQGQLVRLTPPLQTTNEIPSAAIRRYHRQNFMVAENAQEHVDFSRRQISSFTIATDAKRVQRAKKMLNQFMDKLCDALESGEPTEVYTVSTQLFPAQLTRGDNK